MREWCIFILCIIKRYNNPVKVEISVKSKLYDYRYRNRKEYHAEN